jgi:hypothetical protein
MPLMAGLFGIKKEIKVFFKDGNIKNSLNNIFEFINKNPHFITYTLDQNILIELFYNNINIRYKLLVHSTTNIFSDPNFIKINQPEDNNFCGQVIDYDQSGNPFMVHSYKDYAE